MRSATRSQLGRSRPCPASGHHVDVGPEKRAHRTGNLRNSKRAIVSFVSWGDPVRASVREPKCRLTQRNNNSMSSYCKIYGSKSEDINGAKHLFVVEIMRIGLVIGNGTPTTQLVSKPCKRGLSNIRVHLFLQPRMLSFHLNGQGQLLR